MEINKRLDNGIHTGHLYPGGSDMFGGMGRTGVRHNDVTGSAILLPSLSFSI